MTRMRRWSVTGIVLLAAGWAVACGAGDAESVEFHRVHVPAGRLDEVPLGDERYVPMSVTEFEAAVARANGRQDRSATLLPRGVADAVTYTARLDDTGVLVGTATCTISPVAAAVARALPLGGLAAREATFAGEAGPRDAVIFGTPEDGSFLQASEGGTYTFGFICQPLGGDDGGFVLPLVPSLKTTVYLTLPPGRTPMLFGPSARAAVVGPGERSTGDSWRIETGPGSALGVMLRDSDASSGGFAVWSSIDIRGEQASLAATVRPAEPWSGGPIVLDKDPSLRITALEAGAAGAAGAAGQAAEAVGFTESADGRVVTIEVPAWLAKSRSDLIVRGVAPAVGSTWRLPLVAASQSRWAGGGSVVTLDPANGVAGLELDDCRVVTAAVADRWPLPPRRSTALRPDESSMQPAVFRIEEQAPAAASRLTLRPRTPTLDVARVTTVEISPRALLGRAVCDIRVLDGEAFEITARMAPGWIPDSVEALEWVDDGVVGGLAEQRATATALPIDWRFVQSPGGDTLRIGLPVGATPARGLALRVTGHRPGIPPGAAFMTGDVDMVRFDGESAGSAVIDIKTVADSFMEIDDAPVGMLPAEGRLARLVEEGPVRGRIPGGELAANRRARLVTRRPPLDADVSVRLEARDDRLTETFTVACTTEAGGLDSLVVDFSEPMGEGLEWSVVSPVGIAVTSRLLAAGDVARRGAKPLESVSESWLLEFRPPIEEAAVIRAVRTIPFTADTPVPLAWVADARSPRGIVTLLSAGPLLPEVINHRLLELAPAIDGRGTRQRVVEFSYGAPGPAAGPAAELRPPVAGVAARAWAWQEEVTCWCEESGAVDCEARFQIENEGRDAVTLTALAGHRLQSVEIDGRPLPLTAVAAAANVKVPLPAAGSRVEIVVRTVQTSDPRAGWWQVSPHGCGIDLPLLERRVKLLVPPSLEPLAVEGAYREVDPAQAGWAKRLFAVRSADDRARSEARSSHGGFQPLAFVARGGRDGGGIVMLHRRLITSAALLAAVFAGGLAFGAARRLRGASVVICLTAALAALWAPPPLYEVARASWWAGVAGAACGLASSRPRFVAAAVLSWGLSTSAVAGEPDAYRVFVTPASDGDMALVPEPLFRRLAGASQSAAAVRVVRCDVFASAAVGTDAWRVVLDVDADAGGSLLIDAPERGAWRPAEPVAGVLVRPVGRGVRLTASGAGRLRVPLLVEPRIEQRGGLEIAEMQMPGGAVAAVHIAGASLPAGSVACERADAGGPFVRVAAADPTAAAPVFDVSGAARSRVLRPLDPRDRLAASPASAVTVNEVFWGLDACTVATTFSIDAGAELLHSLVLRGDDRLEGLEALTDGAAAVLRPLEPGRWVLELPRDARGRMVVSVSSRMQLVDPVGRFRVPTIWLDGVAGELRTVRVDAAADLDSALDPPVVAGVAAAEFTAAAAPEVTVRRRRQRVRGVQNLAVTFGTDRVTLALRAQLDASSLALTQIPLQVPPGCVIDRVALQDDDLLPAEGGVQRSIDVVWTRQATDRVVVMVQQPRAGRFRLAVDARLRIRPPGRGRLPLLRAQIGGAPLVVACSGEATSGFAVHLGDGPRPGGAADVVEVFDDEPGPEYVIERLDAGDAAAVTAAPPPAAAEELGLSRVQGTDVFLALDGRGRARGAVRFDLVTTESAVRLQLPTGMRLYDVLVDGTDVVTVPRTADTWEVRMHGTAWPRTVLAVFAGDVGSGFAEGRPLSLTPPAVVGLPAGEVLWTVMPPPGVELRLAEPARPLDAAARGLARRGVERQHGERFKRAIAAVDPRQHERLQSLFDLRLGGGVTAPEAAWQRAVGWNADEAPDPAAALAATDGAAPLTLRAVRQPNVTTPGRALATCGLVLVAGVAWAVMARKAGRRRQAESDLALDSDHR